MLRLNGVTPATRFRLGKQDNYGYEFIRQGKMVQAKADGSMWIEKRLFKDMVVLTPGIESKVGTTYELKISTTGSVVTVMMEPPLEGTVLLNGDTRELTLDYPATLYLLPNGTYPVLFTPTNPDMKPVTSTVTVNNS
jgi:hypothetical protein